MILPNAVIHEARKPLGGWANIIVTLIASVTFAISRSVLVVNILSVLVIVAIFSTILICRYRIRNIQITCIQDKPKAAVSARSQHYKEFLILDGFGELEVFVEVPTWITEFEIEMELTEPFDLNAWKKPDTVVYKNRRLSCHENMGDFKFNLTAGGDGEKLGEGTHILTFRDKMSGTKIESISLKTEHERE